MSSYDKFFDSWGIRPLEKFKLYNLVTGQFLSNKFFFTNDLDLFESSETETWLSYFGIEKIVRGNLAIVKIKYKPKNYDIYYYWDGHGASKMSWTSDPIDLAMYEVCNCFETEQEARIEGKKITESLMGKYKQDE